MDAQRTLQGSVITPALEQQVRDTEGVGAVAQIGERTFTVRVDGGSETDASIVGTDDSTWSTRRP